MRQGLDFTGVALGFVSMLVVAFGLLAGIFGYLAARIAKHPDQPNRNSGA